MKRIGLLVLGVCLVVGACSDTKKIAPKEGRISVISGKEMEKSSEKVRLAKARNTNEWTAPNANVYNKIPAVSLTKSTPAWKVSGAEGRSKNDLPMVTPIIVGDRIYTLDTEGRLLARNSKGGKELWRIDLETNAQGVGLTANKKQIIAIDEHGTLKAFDTEGKEPWKKEFKTAFRNSPLMTNESVYLLSLDNNFWVLNAKTGKEKWTALIKTSFFPER